jgi:hypothetical protein
MIACGTCPIARSSDANGNVREGIARERDAPAGFTPEMLATFEREPELIAVAAFPPTRATFHARAT